MNRAEKQKVVNLVNDLMVRIGEILEEEEYSGFMLERVYRMKENIVSPVLQILQKYPRYEGRARRLNTLHAAVEMYVVSFQKEPERRTERRRRIEGLRSRVRRDILRHHDRESELEGLLDDIRRWQWTTTLDETGRIVYSTGSGAAVPASRVIAGRAGIEVIEQAVKAQKPYSDAVRPRDVLGNPGGLIVIQTGKRAIIVGDLHGRYDNLEHILKDKDNLRSILAGEAHLIFTGDAIHPRSSVMNSPDAYEDSFCVMLLIMTLKAENPFNVHYLIGNHDNAHVGGRSTGKGQVRQDGLFEEYTVEKFGPSVFERYKEFVRVSPVAARIHVPHGRLLVVHAGLTPRVLGLHGLVNILVKGRTGYELGALLWSRNYERATLTQCLRNVRANFVISGHTNPVESDEDRYGMKVLAEDVFAHVHGRQVILNAQRNVFGYLDVDLTRPLPERVTDLQASDGRPAFRLLRPKGQSEPEDLSAEEPSSHEESADGSHL